MDTPLQIVFDGIEFERDESAEDIRSLIEEKTEGLERFYHHIIDGRVTVRRDNRRHRFGPVYSVTIEIGVPGKKLVVSHDPGDYERHEVHVKPLITDAFAAMTRQLEDYSRRQRGHVKTHEPPPKERPVA